MTKINYEKVKQCLNFKAFLRERKKQKEYEKNMTHYRESINYCRWYNMLAKEAAQYLGYWVRREGTWEHCEISREEIKTAHVCFSTENIEVRFQDKDGVWREVSLLNEDLFDRESLESTKEFLPEHYAKKGDEEGDYIMIGSGERKDHLAETGPFTLEILCFG